MRIVATGLTPGKTITPDDVMDADWVGITSTSALFGNATQLRDTISAWRPDLPIVLGGAHATVSTASALAAGFDYAILGEAERTVVEFTENPDCGRPHERGIAFHRRRRSRRRPQDLIEDLDTLPFPARDLYDYDAFRAAGGGSSASSPRAAAPSGAPSVSRP